MIKKYHNYTLQTNLWHSEAEPQKTNEHLISRSMLHQSHTTSSDRQAIVTTLVYREY